jgi:hypothetical protein
MEFNSHRYPLRIGVLLAGLSCILEEMLRCAVQGSEIDIVTAAVDTRMPADVTLDVDGPDVIVVPCTPESIELASRKLLLHKRDLSILSLNFVGSSVRMYEIKLVSADIGILGIVEAIRSVVGAKRPDQSDWSLRV